MINKIAILIFTMLIATTAWADGDCYDSTIMNPAPFLGNYTELFELSDGSVWKVGVGYKYLYEYYPAVIVCPNRGILEIGDITLNVTRISVSVSSDAPNATNPPLSRLQNLSTRGMVGTGDNVLIGGFIIAGEELKKIVIRAKGPSLANAGLTDVLADPQMFLFSGQTIIDSNDDWADHDNVHLVPEHLIPTNRWEATIYTELPPGAYTVIISGYNGTTGVAIFEVFEVQ